MNAAVLTGDRTELSTGRRVALLKRRAVAMVGLRDNGRINWVYVALMKLTRKTRRICSRITSGEYYYVCPHARLLRYADSCRFLSVTLCPLLIPLFHNALHQIVLFDVIISTLIYSSESSSIACSIPCKRRHPKQNHLALNRNLPDLD